MAPRCCRRRRPPGWDVQVENSDYGKFVTSINGIANGSEGDASGWVYTVNDEQVMEACDVRQLTAATRCSGRSTWANPQLV